MKDTLRADRANDHPSREPADHANVDPRRSVKHPKIATARTGDKKERPSARG